MYYFHQRIDRLSHFYCVVILFSMDRVTRHLLSVPLIVPCLPVLLDPFKVLSDAILCDRMRNKHWGGSSTASLNNTFLFNVDFVLVNLALLT